ncbi:hypothetical protein [Actinomadura rupiterrae]|uniref:hypothetical protein n=1 Tax=Actinomadura rupiterrae TaxID=559627 RepID=UPI0020A2AEAC|nr:hypothetical protein [Actinomadura rupiterrae]MCP2337275.1 hypothetical protein [Actinomadura rupiterrae]
MVTAVEGEAPAFKHVRREPGGGARTLQNTTRYLCAAVYLNRAVCAAVIDEHLHDPHRAVVPSFGYDLEPVIRHALRARRLRLFRDLLLIAGWVALLVVSPVLVPLYAAVLLAPAIATRVPWGALSWRLRFFVAWALIGLFVGAMVLFWLFVVLLSALGHVIGTQNGGQNGVMQRVFSLALESTGPMMILVTLYFFGVYFGHLIAVLATLARHLGPGATGPGPNVGSERVRALLERIGAAQFGNITLYSGDNPFLGAGEIASKLSHSWSVVLELDRPGGTLLDDEERPDPLSQHASVRPDPTVMHDRIKRSVLAMREPWPSPPGATAAQAMPTAGDGIVAFMGAGPGALAGGGPSAPLPERERVSGLNIGWHVVAPGFCEQRPRPVSETDPTLLKGHPLIDAAARVPFTVADKDAVDAIVHHPQATVRCYQRITVGARCQPVMSRRGRALAPGADRDINLSTFVYLAVEGRMLYAQFVATVLPPVRPEYQVVDLLPDWSGPHLAWKAVRIGWLGAFASLLLPVPRAAAMLWWMARGAWQANTAGDPTTRIARDYGARLSVRELVADTGFHDFLQLTDVDKYTRLIEERVNAALLDYLQECGVDVSAYRGQMATILNQGVIMTGGQVSGQISVSGRGSRVRQAQGVNP